MLNEQKQKALAILDEHFIAYREKILSAPDDVLFGIVLSLSMGKPGASSNTDVLAECPKDVMIEVCARLISRTVISSGDTGLFVKIYMRACTLPQEHVDTVPDDEVGRPTVH